MPTRKKTKRKPSAKSQSTGELREEIALRRFIAKAQLQQAKAMLASHSAADRGRKNRDWKAGPGSADQAIIPETEILNARARDMVRNSPEGQAALREKVRNVVGRGITPIPTAVDEQGQELVEYNLAAEDILWAWSDDPCACDLEKRRTFWHQQRMCEAERFTVGQHMIVWSYFPPGHPRSILGVPGLRLQSFEPEQLDQTIQSCGANEVRGGIEVDEYGAAVAYHFYERNPHDYLSTSYESRRVPAERVMHYFRADRVLQTHGVTDLAPVMQTFRDLSSLRDAVLWRKRMEACIGFIIRRNAPTPTNGVPGIGPLAAGATSTTASGVRTFDVVPGMVPELMPGEDVTPFIPSAQAGDFEAFTNSLLRIGGAGIGTSRGALTRESEGDYSSARQDMLEDEREVQPIQDLLIEHIVQPTYELLIRLAVFEGLLPVTLDEFLSAPRRYLSAEYATPQRPWIDPEKEANAYEKMIQNRLLTRAEIRAKMGGRLRTTLRGIEAEREDAKTKGITFPEDASPAAQIDPEMDRVKGKADAFGVATRAGMATPTIEDEIAFRREAGLPEMSPAAKEAWEKDGGVRRPITLTAPDGSRTPPGGASPAIASEGMSTELESKQKTRSVSLAQIDAPNYRDTKDSTIRCATCSLAKGTHCTAYDFDFTPVFVCDAWEAMPVKDSNHTIIPPGPIEGTAPIDNPQSPFNARSS